VNAKNEDVAEFGPAISIDTKTETGRHQNTLLNFQIPNII
jgi:hypothetical protein